MRFAAFEGESRFSDLIDRLFAMPPKSPAALRKRVEEALRNANPQLANLRKVPRGAPILVPEVPGVQPAGDDLPTAAPWGDVVGSLTRSLTMAQRSVEDLVQREAAAHDQTVQLLKSRELREHAKEDAELKERIDRLEAASSNRLKESQAGAERRMRGLAALNKDLEEFSRIPRGAFAVPDTGDGKRRPTTRDE